MSNVGMARLALAYLKNRSYTWVTTSHLIGGLGLNGNKRQLLLPVLHKLAENGVISRMGRGKYRWILEGEYDYDNPFSGSKGKGEPGEDDDVQPEDIEDRPQDIEEEESEYVDPNKIVLKKTSEEKEVDSKEIKELKARVSVLEAIEKEHLKSIRILTDAVVRLEEDVNATRVIEIKQHGKAAVKLEGIIPAVFDRVLDLAGRRRNILLIGPAGCGKTTVGELVAKALKLEFGAIPCTSGMSETQLIGKEIHNLTTGKTKYQMPDFIKCFEEGGVFLLDELDAADPNVLLVLNSALSNGYVNLPARNGNTRAVRHKDFICVATANTVGRGANRTYAGRSQLDEATLDRFRIGTVECDYDKKVERAICPDEEILNTCWNIRAKIDGAAIRRVMSTRFIGDAYIMKSEAGWKIGDILQSYFVGWTEEEKRRVQGVL